MGNKKRKKISFNSATEKNETGHLKEKSSKWKNQHFWLHIWEPLEQRSWPTDPCLGTQKERSRPPCTRTGPEPGMGRPGPAEAGGCTRARTHAPMHRQLRPPLAPASGLPFAGCVLGCTQRQQYLRPGAVGTEPKAPASLRGDVVRTHARLCTAKAARPAGRSAPVPGSLETLQSLPQEPGAARTLAFVSLSPSKERPLQTSSSFSQHRLKAC